MNRFEQALKQPGPLLLDGGLATELEARGHDLDTDLWSARLLLEDPEAIVGAHHAFLAAGARCVISASYQASRRGLMALGCSAHQADATIARSVELAREARRRFLAAHPHCGYVPLVAASIGPYGAVLHDGSEYTGRYDRGAAGLAAFHRERLGVLDRAGADVLACETIPSLVEARVLSELLRHTATPAWVSFSCRDERHISDGTPLAEAAALFAEHPRILAVGINCTAPHLIEALIGEVREAAPGKAVVVYPNSGEIYRADRNCWGGTAEPMEGAAAAGVWLAAGARLIGGCCRMGPTHIAAMARELGLSSPKPAH